MYILPKPTRYWSLRFDGSASGSPRTFTSNNQGLDTLWPLWSKQLNDVTPVGTNYLDATGYSSLRYIARVASSTRVGNTYTDLALFHDEATVRAINAPLFPSTFYSNWTINLWVKGLTGNNGLQIIFLNGGFYKALGDTTVKPYFMYTLVVENNVLKFLVLNKAGNIESEAAIALNVSTLENSRNQWSNVTVSNNTLNREITLSLNSPRLDVFGNDAVQYSITTNTTYTIDNVINNPQTNIGDWKVQFGRLFNYGAYDVPSLSLTHAQAKVFWPYGKNYTQYKNWTNLSRPPIAFPYVPKDTDIEDYGVSTSIDICHVAVWEGREIPGSYLAQIKYPFDASYFTSTVSCFDSSTVGFIPTFNMIDTISVYDEHIMSSKVFDFVSTVTVSQDFAKQNPKRFNVVDTIKMDNFTNTPSPLKPKFSNNVTIADQVRCNIMYFTFVDGLSIDHDFRKSGTLRIDVVDSVGTSDGEKDQPPKLLSVVDTITVDDVIRTSTASYTPKNSVAVTDSVFKTGPQYFSVVSGLTIRSTQVLNKSITRAFITCVKLKSSGNKAIEFDLSSSTGVTQSSTHDKVYSLVSSLVVNQTMVPSDIDYSDPCLGDVVKANVPTFSSEVAVSDAVGVVSGITYIMADEISVNQSSVGFLIRTSGYNPYSGAI